MRTRYLRTITADQWVKCGPCDTCVTATARAELSTAQQSRKGCSSEGQAPLKPPRGTRSSPGSNHKGGKPQGTKLNCPPKSGTIHVRNRLMHFPTWREDYYGTDQDNTLKNVSFYPMEHAEHEFQLGET